MNRNFDYGKVSVASLAAIYFLYCALHPTDWHFVDYINLIFHEAGHVLFMFFGEFLHVLGGSAFQVLFPLVFVSYFFMRRDYFSSSILLMWVGQSIINVSVYSSDAIVMQLPLLGGDNVIHDWNYILTNTGLLSYTSKIGSTFYMIGVAIIIVSIFVCFSSTRRKSESRIT